jgi:3-oxoacyl-[acyl-carrier protein] reductase
MLSSASRPRRVATARNAWKSPSGRLAGSTGAPFSRRARSPLVTRSMSSEKRGAFATRARGVATRASSVTTRPLGKCTCFGGRTAAVHARIARVALAVVTGAGSGIGRAVAIELARRGLDVALVGRTAETLRETAAEVGRVGRAIVLVADVSIEPQVRAAAAEIAGACGAPRVVVHAAGIAGRKARVEDVTEAEWDAVMASNLRGTFLVTRALLPSMRASGAGRFVAIASISATLGTDGLAPYCASKWGVVGLTKSLAEELRGSGLQAMAVLPGTVDTAMAKVGGFTPQMSAGDVARLVAYVALDAPDAMNGSAVECFGP